MIDLRLGDALEVLQDMPDNSVDAICCDPPAGISMMGRAWDGDKGGRHQWIAWMTEIMAEALRVAKPGAGGFLWALPRTSHWTATALEDAGWEIRQVHTHIFSTGFPKSKSMRDIGRPELGSAEKPATEHWIRVRKPLERGLSIAANVVKWGTGAINVDASRIASTDGFEKAWDRPVTTNIGAASHNFDPGSTEHHSVDLNGYKPSGRFPSNLLLSHVSPDEHGNGGCERVGVRRVKSPKAGEPFEATNKVYGKWAQFNNTARYADADGMEVVDAYVCVESCPVRILDEQSGEAGSTLKRRYGGHTHGGGKHGKYGKFKHEQEVYGYGDTGGASRFFKVFGPEEDIVPMIYVPKASRRERNLGCEGLPEREARRHGDTGPSENAKPNGQTAIREGNHHPTVKPLALIKYLAAMICPPGGTLLDCFAGSGTTGVAAVELGFNFIGVEMEPDYFAIMQARINAALAVPVQHTIDLVQE